MKHFLSLFLFLVSTMVMHAQSEESFGVKGGLNLTFFNVDENDLGTFATSETGFYGGVFVEFPIDDFFSIQPEALFISVGDFKFINVPIYAKYKVANSLYFMAGPSANYFFDFFTNKFKVGADISSGYNLSSSLDIHVKLALGIQEMAPNGLFFGLGIKL